ncbi:MAG TPA: hypothetical protein VG675_20650 [Bryobacteraceae bacterium]|nr:hypothetical protein [Bryobacteraceae bacterium]
MFRRTLIMAGIFGLAASVAMADFSYEENSKITGGMLAGVMKFAGVFSKQAREPLHATVAVKGDQMVRRSQVEATVIDLQAQTITTINLQKKTYSVMTFDQMKQMLAQMSQKMKESKDQSQNQTQMNFKVTANNTGNTKQVGDYQTKELILKMEMEGTDQKTGEKGSMVITTDMWLAPSIAGYQEVRNFYKKMAQTLNWTPGGNMFMANPQVADGMAEVTKEMAKLDGVPVLQNVSMGGAGESGPNSGQAQAASSDSQQQQQQAQPAERPSIGSVLGGRFGRFGRKKPQQDTSSQSSTTQQTQEAQQGQQSAAGTLIEMTTELSNFSTGAVDASQFAVPAGFKKVEPDTRRMQ